MYGDVAGKNRDTLETLETFPGRFFGYLVYNPWYEQDLDEILAAFEKNDDLVGFKPYEPATEFPLDGDRYDDIWSFADKHRLIVLAHLELDRLAAIDRLTEQFQNVQWIVPHAGQSFEMAEGIVEIALKWYNIWTDITHTNIKSHLIEFLVEHLGSGRVLFGTDMPMRDPAPQLGWVCFSRCSHEDRFAMLGGNFLAMVEHTRGHRITVGQGTKT